MHKLDMVDQANLRTDIPEFRAGDTVKVHVRVIEGNRTRVQVFQGVVIRRHGGGVGETYTVRKVSFGVGVERTFPLHTPVVEKIEVVTRGDVRRAKLYYLRNLRCKAAKIREKRLLAGSRGTHVATAPRTDLVGRGAVAFGRGLPGAPQGVRDAACRANGVRFPVGRGPVVVRSRTTVAEPRPPWAATHRRCAVRVPTYESDDDEDDRTYEPTARDRGAPRAARAADG